MIRVGIAGYGLAGRVFHAPLVVTTPDVELVGVVTRNPGRGDQVAVDHPDAVVVPDVDALFGLGIDLLVVATTNDTHVPLARAAFAAGVSVVVDKPLAPTAAEGQALVSEAEAAGVLLSSFQNRRWDADFLTLQTLVQAGALGDVRRLESRFERWRPELGGGWRERNDPGTAGGLLFDLGSHLVDQALVLLGPVVSVYAETDRRRSPEAADDDVFVALEHASGARSHLWASAVAPQYGPRFRALGSRAAYTCFGLDGQEDALRLGGRPGPGWGEVPPEQWGVLGTVDEEAPVASLPGAYPTYYAEMAAAVAAHLEGLPVARGPGGSGSARIAVPVDPRDSVRGLELLEAARHSATTHAVVPV